MAKSENKGKKCCKYRHDTVCKTLVAKKVAKWQKKGKKAKNCRGKIIRIIIRILILISMIFRFYFNTMSLLRKAMYQYCCRLRVFIRNSANHWC